MKTSQQLFENSLKRQQEELKTYFNNLINHVGAISIEKDEKEKNVRALITRIISVCTNLQNNIVNSDRPPWLNPLTKSCEAYLNDFNSDAFSKIFAQHHNLFNHQLNSMAIGDGFNFDAIYRECREKSELPKFLDELISLLEKLINECGDDIQAKTLHDLNQLIASVKLNRNGSYGAIQSTLLLIWEFFKTSFFILHPYVAIAKSAFDTIFEIEKTLKSAHHENEKIGKQVADKSIKLLKHDFIYSKNGLLENKSMIPEQVRVDLIG